MQLKRHEHRVHSQNGEDGVIGWLLSEVGSLSRYFIELGVGDGSQCNTRYLAEQGWQGLWLDASDCENPSVKRHRLNAENIVPILNSYKAPTSFDLLSIDLDSNDYWIFRALSERYHPRVIVVEYNASYPPPLSVAVTYDPDLVWQGTDYFGASLSAWYRLMKRSGYALIGCESRGVNAFFVQQSLMKAVLKPLTDEEAYCPPAYGRRHGEQYLGHPPDERRLVAAP